MSDNLDAEFEKACAAMSQEQSPASVAAQAEKGPSSPAIVVPAPEVPKGPLKPEEFAAFSKKERTPSEERLFQTILAQSAQIQNMMAGNKNFCLALAVLCLRQGGSIQLQQRELKAAQENKYGENLQMRQVHETGAIDFRVKLPSKIVLPSGVPPNIVQGVFPCPKK